MAFTERPGKKEIERRYLPRLLPISHPSRAYPVISVGSPNWCGTVAPPLASWLCHNSLSGKLILPFYSHCDGVPCDLRRGIQALCPKAEVRKALGVLDRETGDADENIQQWLFRTRAYSSTGTKLCPSAHLAAAPSEAAQKN